MKTSKSTPVSIPNKFHHPVLIPAFILFLNSFFGAYQYGQNQHAIDLYTWWLVPHGVEGGYIKTLYVDNDRKKLAEETKKEFVRNPPSEEESFVFDTVLKMYDGQVIMTATPFFYATLSHLISGNFLSDKDKFLVILLIAFTAAFFILGRMLRFPYLTLFLLFSVFVSWYFPYLSDMRVANINQIQLFLVTLFIFLLARGEKFSQIFGAGLALGFSVILKPNTCFILLFAFLGMLLNKDIRKMGAFALGVLVSWACAFIEAAAYFKTVQLDIWKRWFVSLNINSCPFTIHTGNYSLAKILADWMGFNISLLIYAIMIGLFVWVWFSLEKSNAKASHSQQSMREEKALKETFLIYGFGCLTLFLASGLVWLHYHLLMVPLFFFFLRPETEFSPRFKTHPLTKPFTYITLGLLTTMVTMFLKTSEWSAFFTIFSALIFFVLLILEMKSQKN